MLSSINLNQFPRIDDELDDQGRFDRAILHLTNLKFKSNGGTIEVPSGEFLVKGLVLNERITIRGQGQGSTILKLKNNSNKDVIKIPNYAFSCSIENLSIDGNKSNNLKGNGISLSSNPNSMTELSMLKKKESKGQTSYIHFNINNVSIFNSADNGVYIPGTNYITRISNLYVFGCNNHGILNHSTDNLFTSLYLEKNGKSGLCEQGNNNKWVNVKSIWNGELDNSYGAVRVSGFRNHFTNVEAQDNYTHGFYIKDSIDCVFDSCLSDCNGYLTYNTSTNNHYGFYCENSNNVQFKSCIYSNYRGSLSNNTQPMKKGYLITADCRNIVADIVGKGANESSVSKEENRYSDQLICFRNSVEKFNDKIYEKDEPIINNGLIIHKNSKIIIPNSTCESKTLSFIMDFKFEESDDYPRLIKSKNGNLEVIYVKNSKPYIQINMKIGKLIYSRILSITLLEKIEYRLSFRLNISENKAYMFSMISYCDNDVIKNIENGYGFTVDYGQVFEINEIYLNQDSNFKIKMTVNKLIMTNQYINEDKMKVGENWNYYLNNSTLYFNFLNHYENKNLYSNTLPNPSNYYRGKFILLESNKESDKLYICVKKNNGSFEWKLI